MTDHYRKPTVSTIHYTHKLPSIYCTHIHYLQYSYSTLQLPHPYSTPTVSRNYRNPICSAIYTIPKTRIFCPWGPEFLPNDSVHVVYHKYVSTNYRTHTVSLPYTFGRVCRGRQSPSGQRRRMPGGSEGREDHSKSKLK